MTTKNKSNTPLYDAGMALASRDMTDNAGRIRVYLALEKAGATAESLAKGDDYEQLRDGYLVAWQGLDFATAFANANGKVMLKGTIVDRIGVKRKESKSRESWQRDLGSKVTKARGGFVAWLAGKEAPEEGAPKEGATKAGQGAARDLAIRVTEDIGKLFKAVTKDRDCEAPTLKADHKELLAAFQRCLDLVK